MLSPQSDADRINPDRVREQLNRIESSETFRNVPRQRQFLRFVVEDTLAGHATQLTGSVIANEVFNGADDKMRPEAGRLRDKLHDYYLLEAPLDPIRIDIPKGKYIPTFSWTFPPTSRNTDDAREASVQRRVTPSAGQTPQTWNIPPRNQFFTARDTYLECLRGTLTKRSCDAISPLAITGIGGVGKTQTAIEYAYRYREHYAAAIWINADSQESLLSGFVSAANLLDLPQRDEKDAGIVASGVCRWLQAHTDWLLIFDNIDDLNVIGRFLPNGNGHCVITTRLQATGGMAQGFDLTTLSLAQGALFLLRRSKLLSNNAPLEAASATNRRLAEEITAEVGGLPLALDQAGAFVEETPSTLGEYLSFYRSEGAALRALHGQFSTDHTPVTITFSLAFESLGRRNAVANDLIRASAFLAPDGIPEEIFVNGGMHLGGSLAQIVTKPLAFTEALREAARFSLIRRNAANRSIDIHRLIQDVVKDGMDDNERQSWIERVIHALALIFPLPEFHNWNQCERLVSHVTTLVPYIQQYSLINAPAGRILSNCGLYLCHRARYREALKLLTEALAIREKALGPEHPDTATTLNALGQLRSRIGNYREAATLYQRALAIREKTLGPEHPDTATTLNNIADVYVHTFIYAPTPTSADQVTLKQAATLYQRALAIREKALGPEHPDTGNSIKSLAELCRIQNRFSEADKLYRRALAISEKVLGPEHPDTAQVLNGLALLYHCQGLYGKAESLLQRTISMTETVLGPEHPDIAATLDNYAALLRDTGRESEADVLAARANEMRAKLVNLQGSKELTHVSELIGKSDLDDAIKARLKEDLRCWGLTDRVREVTKAYCLENLRKLDGDIALGKIFLSITDAKKLMAHSSDTTLESGLYTQLQSYYEEAKREHRNMLAAKIPVTANVDDIEASLDTIKRYLDDHLPG